MGKPIFLLGEAFGSNEVKIGKGFVGASGIELLKMLHESHILELTSEDFAYINKFYNANDPTFIDCIWQMHPEVYRSNVFQFHPPGNDIESVCGTKDTALPGYPPLLKSKFVRLEFAEELSRLGDELLTTDPNIILAFGNTALWALTGKTGVMKLRGTTQYSTHTIDGFKLLPTYHPAAVLRQWENRPITIIDLIKAKRESEYAEIRRPRREIWIEPEISDIMQFIDQHIKGCSLLSVDIETSGNQITNIGFAPRRDIAINIPFYDSRKKGRSYWPTRQLELQCWGLIREVLEDKGIKKEFQNGMYDIAFIWRSVGIRIFGASEDTMLEHHALQPESLKGLAFLGSVYTSESSWKSERKVSTIKRDA